MSLAVQQKSPSHQTHNPRASVIKSAAGAKAESQQERKREGEKVGNICCRPAALQTQREQGSKQAREGERYKKRETSRRPS